jgi:corrinoid protein of di/trimethylamine methyltransferase
MMQSELFKEMAQSILDGDDDEAAVLAERSVQQGVDPLDAINQGFILGVNEVGRRYSEGDMFLPDLVLAGEAMKAAVAVLEPEMERRGTERQMLGTVVLGTVEGDIHDIGKTLVGTMLTAGGFEVIDLGVDVPVTTFIETAREHQADIVGLSALLTTTMVVQQSVVEALEEAGLREQVKVMVGGAPVTSGWSQEIGADGFSEDAIGAVGVARRLVGV